jgi:hypothetical protein
MHIAHASSDRFSRNNRHSPRNGLRLIACSPRCAGLSSHRHFAHRSRSLIPASGDRDHTPLLVRPSCARLAPMCVHRIPRSTFVTTRNAPLVRAGRDSSITISAFRKQNYFCSEGWTGVIELRSLEKSEFWRTSFVMRSSTRRRGSPQSPLAVANPTCMPPSPMFVSDPEHPDAGPLS